MQTLTRSRPGAAILLCASLIAVSCNRSTEKRIVFIPKGRAHVFWQSVHAGAVAAMRENPGYSIIWNGPASETDYEGQIKIVDAAINQRVDVICLAPIDKKILVSLVERAMSANIPVIIFDSPVDTQSFTAQVATDNLEGGRMAAKRIGEILNGKGRIVEVAVQPGGASTMAREQGFEEKLAADFAQSLKVAENMLTAAPDLTGIFASNESSTVGALRALKDRKGIKLVGFDSSPQLIEALKGGVIDSLIAQDPFQMGYKSMKAAVQKLKGGTPDKIQDIPPTLVTRENMDAPEIQAKINPDLDKYLK